MAAVKAAYSVFSVTETQWDRDDITDEEAGAREKESNEAHDRLRIKEQDLAAITDMLKGFYAFKSAPSYLKRLIPQMAEELNNANTPCSHCHKVVRGGDLDVTNCGHFYCKHCLLTLKNPVNKMSETKGMWDCVVCKSSWPHFGH